MKFKDAQAKSVKMFSNPEFIKRIKEEDETMLKHMNILQKINSSGYLTIESQAGNRKNGLSVIDGNKYEIRERSYIAGFMKEEDASIFIKQMALDTDKNAMYIPYCSNDMYMPSKLDIPLTVTIKNKLTTVTTHNSSALPNNVWHMLRKNAHINKSEKIAYIFCWDSKWCRNASSATGLFTDVLKVLKEISK